MILGVLEKYIKFERTESLGLKGFNGTLNEDLLSQFFDCKLQGHVKFVDISVVGGKKVKVEGVYILISLTSEERGLRKPDQNTRQRKLEANNIEMRQRYKDEKAMENKTEKEKERECLEAQKAKAKAKAKKDSGPNSLLIAVVNYAIKGIRVDISKIHVRIDTDSGSYGIILDSLNVAKDPKPPKDTNKLVCKLNGLKMYADPPPDKKLPDSMEGFVNEMERLRGAGHSWIFTYSTGDNNNISLEIRKKPSKEEAVYNIYGLFPQFSINLTKEQYNGVLCSLSGKGCITEAKSRVIVDKLPEKKFAKFSRMVFWIKIWWRRRYIDTYRAFLESKGRRYDKEFLEKVEKFGCVETIILCRYIALAETTKSFQEKLKANGINRSERIFDPLAMMMVGGAAQPEVQEERNSNTWKSLKSDFRNIKTGLMDQLGKEEKGKGGGGSLTSSDEDAKAIAELEDAMKMTNLLLQTTLSMAKFEITLRNEADDKEPILQASLDTVEAKVRYGKEGGLNVTLNVMDMGVTGVGQARILEKKKRKKKKGRASDKKRYLNQAMFNFTLSKKMVITVQPFFLTFEDSAVGKILEFFVPPQGLDIARIGAHLRESFGMYSLLARDELIERNLVPGPGEGLLGMNLTVTLLGPTIRMYGDNGLEAGIGVNSVELNSISKNSDSNPELIIQTGFDINVNGVSFALKRNSDSDNDDDDDDNNDDNNDDDGGGDVLDIVKPFDIKMNLGLPVYNVRDGGDGIPILIGSIVEEVEVCLGEDVLSSSLDLLRPFLDRLFPIVNNYLASLTGMNSGNGSCKIGVESPAIPVTTSVNFGRVSLRWSDSKSGAPLLESSLGGVVFSCTYARFLLSGDATVKNLSVCEHFSGAPCELLSVCGAKVEIKDTNGSHADLDCTVDKVASALNVCSIAQTVNVATKLATSFVPIIKETIVPIITALPQSSPEKHEQEKEQEQEQEKELITTTKSSPISLDSIPIPLKLKLKVRLKSIALNVFDPKASVLLDIADLSSEFSMDNSFNLSLDIRYLSAGVLPRSGAPQGSVPRKMVVLGSEQPQDPNKKEKMLEVKFIPKKILLNVKTRISNVRVDTSDLRELMNFAARSAALFAGTKANIQELQKEIEKGGEEEEEEEEEEEGAAALEKVKDFLFLTPREKLPTVIVDASVTDVVLDFVPPFAPRVSIRIEVPSVSYKNSETKLCSAVVIKGVRMGSLGRPMLDGALNINVIPSVEIDREAKELRVGVSCGMSEVYFVVVPEQVPALMYLAVGGIQSMFSSVSSDAPLLPSFLKLEIKGVALPSVLAQLRLGADISTTVMEVLIQRINVTGTILPDTQTVKITGRRLLVAPVRDPKDAAYNPAKWPSEEGANTVEVRITRSVDADAFRYGVHADVSELKINEFNTRSIFRGLLPFAARIAPDFAGNICLPPCEKDRVPTLVDVVVNLPEIALGVQDVARMEVSPIEITFGVNFHGAILGARFGLGIAQGLSLRFPAGPEFLAVPSFSAKLSTKVSEGGLTEVAVGDVRCALSPSVGSNVIAKFLSDMFKMAAMPIKDGEDDDDEDDESVIVVVSQKNEDEGDGEGEAIPSSDAPALHPVLGQMKVSLTVGGLEVTLRKSETEPSLPGEPLVVVSGVAAATPALSELIGGAAPARVTVGSVRAAPSRASLSVLLDTIHPVMSSVSEHTKSAVFLSSSSGRGRRKKPAGFSQKDVSRLLALLPSVRVEAEVSLVEVVWKKLFSVAVSSVALGCSLERSKAATLDVSVERIHALDIHEVATHGFVLLDTPAGTKFVTAKGSISEQGVEAQAGVASLTVTLTPDTINSFVEDAKWLASASSGLVTLSESISASSAGQKRAFLLPVSVTAAVGGIAARMYESYSAPDPILVADVGVERAAAALRFADDGAPRVEKMEVALSRLSARGQLGDNVPAASVGFRSASAALGSGNSGSGSLKVCCELDVTVQAENIMGLVNRLAAMDFGSLGEQGERYVDENHREWGVTGEEQRQVEILANSSFLMEAGTRREETPEAKYPALKAVALASKALRQKVPVELHCSARARLCARGYGSFSLFVQDLEFKETGAQAKTLSFGLAASHTKRDESMVSLCDKRYVRLAVEHAPPDGHLKVGVSMDAFAVSVSKDVLVDLLAAASIAMSENAPHAFAPSEPVRAAAAAAGSVRKGREEETAVVFNRCNGPRLTVKRLRGVIDENTFCLDGWGKVSKIPQLLKGRKDCLKFRKDGDPQTALYLVVGTGDGALSFTADSTFSVTNKTCADIALCFGQPGGSAPDDEALALGRGTVVPRRSVGSAPPQFMGERGNMRIRMAGSGAGGRALWSEPFSMAEGGGEEAWVLQPCFVDPSTEARSYVTVICKRRVKSALRVKNCSVPNETAPTFECLVLSALNIKNALPAEIALSIQDRRENVVSQLVVPEAETVSACSIKRQENIELRIEVTIAGRYKARLKLSARYPSLAGYASLNELIRSGKTSSLEFEDPSSQVARVLSVSLSDSVRGEDGAWTLRFDYQYRVFNYLPIELTAKYELDLSTPTRPQKLVARTGNEVRLFTRNDSVLAVPTDKDDTYDLEAKMESCVVVAKVSTKTRSVVISSYYRVVNRTGRRLCVWQQGELKKKEVPLESGCNVFLLCEKVSDGDADENTQITLQVDGYEETSIIKLRELSNDGTTYIKIHPKGDTTGAFKILHIITTKGDSKNITVAWDDGTAPMVIRNLTKAPITVFQKGCPDHKQVIGPTMQAHFAWSAIKGKEYEAVNVEGCSRDFPFSHKETIGKLLGCAVPKKIKSSTTVEDGIGVMTFLDERPLGLKITEGNLVPEEVLANYLIDTTYLDLSVNISKISVQIENLLGVELSGIGLFGTIKSTRYEAKALIENVEVLNLSTKTELEKILAKSGTENLVVVELKGLLSKRREVTNTVQKMDFRVEPIALSINRAAIVDLINFANDIKSYIPISPQAVECDVPANSSSGVIKFCVLDLHLSKLGLSLSYSDDHTKGDGFENLVGRSTKILLKYLAPLVSKACSMTMPEFKSDSCIMFQNVGQLAGFIGKYYLMEMMKFWKK